MRRLVDGRTVVESVGLGTSIVGAATVVSAWVISRAIRVYFQDRAFDAPQEVMREDEMATDGVLPLEPTQPQMSMSSARYEFEHGAPPEADTEFVA